MTPTDSGIPQGKHRYGSYINTTMPRDIRVPNNAKPGDPGDLLVYKEGTEAIAIMQGKEIVYVNRPAISALIEALTKIQVGDDSKTPLLPTH